MEEFTVIRLEEKSFTNNIFSLLVTVRDADGSEEQTEVQLKDPFDKGADELLEWYFEDYINSPYDDIRRPGAVKTITEYGQNLFRNVFTGNTNFRYRIALQNNGPEKLIVEVVGDSPEFQRIFWEGLHDPEREKPLSAQGVVFVRKNKSVLKVKATVKTSPALNLLIVTARPNEESDVNYRTIQRPLVDLVEKTETPVIPYILRPGTYEALVKHLDGKTGYYHIIHFDLHGSLLDFNNYNKRFHESYGLQRIDKSAFNERERAFVFFESNEKGKPVLVDASQLAELLEDKQIPICILNACQSAKQSNSLHETSLGRHLIRKGIHAIVAMRYSVSVTAATIMMETLYEQLYSTRDIDRAVVAARQQLFRKKSREAAYNYAIELEDWLLPVIYQNGKPSLTLRPFTPEELTKFHRERRVPEEAELNLAYGFFGRDLDILKIEKTLLLRSNILLLQGMGGAGKTTLLKYISGWWLRTGFIKQVFYFGYDIKAYTLKEIIYHIAQCIYTTHDYASFTALSFDIQLDSLAKILRSNHYALILDNTESITGEKLSIPHTLSENERNTLKKFISRLKDGKTAVIIGSRSNEEWLKHGTFEHNKYILEGLDDNSASNFAHSILESLGLPVRSIVSNPNFTRLMSLLAGYPLALKAILPNLKSKTAADILKDIQEGLGEIDKANVQQRTESIIKCIEYAHSNLSEEARHLLLCLAPFPSIVNVTPQFILSYYKLVTDIGNQQDFEIKLNKVIEEAVQNGFMQEAAHELSVKIMVLQPVFTYFLRNKLKMEDPELYRDLETKFIYYYHVLYDIFYGGITQRDSQKALPWMRLMQYEYNNFYKVLTLVLDRRERISFMFSLLEEYLDRSGRQEDRIALGEMVYQRIRGVNIEEMDSSMLEDAPHILIRIGDIYRQSKRYDHAINTYRYLLNLYSSKPSLATNKLIGIAFQDLAIAYLDRGASNDDEEALRLSEEALKYYGRDEEFLVAHVHRNIGSIHHNRDNNELAKEYFYKSLETYKKNNSLEHEGIVHQNLALIAAAENDFATFNSESMLAINCYKAIDSWLAVGQIYMNLGVNAFRNKNYADAFDFYQEALKLFVEYDHEYFESLAYLNLGSLNMEQRQFDQGKRYYKKALTTLIRYPEAFQPIGDVLKDVMHLVKENNDHAFEKEVIQILAIAYGGGEAENLLEWAALLKNMKAPN